MKKYIFSFTCSMLVCMLTGSRSQGQNAVSARQPIQASPHLYSAGSTELKNELKDAVENVSLRTSNSSTWKTSSGKIIVRYSSSMINYKDKNGNFQPMSLVTGPKSHWSGGSTPSCLYPNFYSDSMLITIPAGIRITFFTIDYSYETDVANNIPLSDGLFYFSTPCGAIDTIRCNEAQSGFCYLPPGSDFSAPLTTCFNASCSVQSFWLTAHLSRFHGGLGCDTSTVWYSKYNCDSIYTFSAYLEGEPIINIADNVTAQFGPCNGGIKVMASGGTSPYTYLWSPNNETTDSVGSLCSGNYCCTVTDSRGCSDSICMFVPSKIAGVNTLTNKSAISIYPNPNNGNFSITGITTGQVIELYNSLGQKLSAATADNSAMQVNIPDKADGVYLIRVSNKDGSLVTEEKVIKTQ